MELFILLSRVKVRAASTLAALFLAFPAAVSFAQEYIREEQSLSDDRSEWEVIYKVDGQEVARQKAFCDGSRQFSGRIPDGVYKAYYPSGKLMKELSFREGKLDGVCRYYSEAGDVLRLMNYRQGKLNGTVKEYDANGVLLYEETWAADKRVEKKIHY